MHRSLQSVWKGRFWLGGSGGATWDSAFPASSQVSFRAVAADPILGNKDGKSFEAPCCPGSQVRFTPCRVSNPWPTGHMRPRMVMNEAQHKIVNLLKPFLFAHQFFICSLVFVYLMCGPRQLFFQCGPEMPKSWTPRGILTWKLYQRERWFKLCKSSSLNVRGADRGFTAST